MKDGITRYTPSQGFLKLREVLAKKITKENNFEVTPDEIVITCGAKHALYLSLQCLLNPGDSVLVPTPGWVSYGSMIELAGGNLIPLPLFEEDGFQANVERWKGLAIPKSVKGILLNTPNNPTGVVYDKKDLIKLVGWALQRNLWILADEIYEKILYDGAVHTSIASLGPEVKNNTITISGFSKSYSMTGWRLGWGVGDKELIKKMSALQSQSNSNVTSFVQWAGITACELNESVTQDMVRLFDKRRKYCMQRLDSMKDKLSYTVPQGAFYFFINLTKWLVERKMTDSQFCSEFLEKYHVAIIPGISFGKENYVRLSYANSEDNLKKAFDRMERFLNS
jgi:aspartate aminotransferase